MSFTSIRVQNFRSYTDASFDFDTTVNVIVGPNASGKTSLLEALCLAATGTSMDARYDSLITHDELWSRIDCLTSANQKRIVKLNNNAGVIKKEIIVDDRPYKRLPKEFMIPVVSFEPNHLYFITTSPDMRRQLLDSIIAKTNSTFSTVKLRYQKTLSQRNALLKQHAGNIAKQMFPWNIRLSEIAGQYVSARLEAINKLNSNVGRIYSQIASNTHSLLLRYDTAISTDGYASGMLKKLEADIDKDQQRGFTGCGPHRDDIELVLDGQDMRDVASRGETRTILLAIKVVEADLVETTFKQRPILLFDDVFGELDGRRRKALISYMKDSQTFITTTDADIVSHDLSAKSNLILV